MKRKVKLDSLCDFINGGAWSDKEYVDDGIAVLKVSNCKLQGFDLSNVNYLSVSSAEKYKEHKLKLKDVVVTTVGSHPTLVESAAGRAFIVNEAIDGFYLNQNAVCIRSKDKNILNQKYLGYLAKSTEFKNFIQMRGRGAANQMRIAIGTIKDFEFVLPRIDEQNKISHILSAYDDLIENNQKQIKLLEEAAQRLYKEWFVDLRFPGHEDVEIVDGLPRGWSEKLLIDVAEIQYGYSFDGKLFNSNGEGNPIVRIRNISDGVTSDFTTEEADNDYIIHNGDIIVGMDGEFHINSWCGHDAYLVQRTCSIRPYDENMKGFIFQAIYEPIKFFEATLVGATVAHLGKKHLDTIKIKIAPDKLLCPFQEMFKQRQCLLNQNRMLAEARDRLLPKLMSGEVEV